jgi:hypothetical protein
MRIRYRKLKGEVTEKTFNETVSAINAKHDEEYDNSPLKWMSRRHQHGPGLVESTVLAYFEAAREVTATDGEAEHEVLEVMIVKRQLAPTDLVYTGDGCWVEVRQHPLFDEACQYVEDEDRSLRGRLAKARRMFVKALPYLVTFLLALLLAVAWIWWSGEES